MYQQLEGSFESIRTTMGPKKTIYKSKEIELSFLFHSIRLNELVILVCSFSKLDEKWPSYGHAKRAQKWRWPISV